MAEPIKVKELIRMLEKEDPNATVFVPIEGGFVLDWMSMIETIPDVGVVIY